MKCVENIPVDDVTCLQSCEGLFVTAFDRREFDDKTTRSIMSKIENDYSQYKSKESVSFHGNANFKGWPNT